MESTVDNNIEILNYWYLNGLGRNESNLLHLFELDQTSKDLDVNIFVLDYRNIAESDPRAVDHISSISDSIALYFFEKPLFPVLNSNGKRINSDSSLINNVPDCSVQLKIPKNVLLKNDPNIEAHRNYTLSSVELKNNEKSISR